MRVAIGRGTAARIGFLVDAITAGQTYPAGTGTADTQTRVLGAGSLLPASSETLTMTKETEPDETLDGGAAATGHEVVGRKYGGEVNCEKMAYQGLDELFACALGYEAHSGGAHAGVGTMYPYPATVETGTATSGGNTTLVDTSKTWVTNAYAGWYVQVYGATGADQVRRVTSNTANTLTVPTWTTNPASGSLYRIAEAWLHHFELDDDIHTRCWYAGEGWLFGRGLVFGQTIPRRGTLCVAPHLATQSAEPKCFEYCASMVRGFTLSVTPRASSIVFRIVSFYRDRDATNQDPTTWTMLESVEKFVAWPDWVFRIGDFSAATGLGDDNKLGVSSFTLTVDNNLAVDDQDTVSGAYIAEPARTGLYTVSGGFTLPRYTSDTYIGKFEDDSILMADLKATGDLINATESYVAEFYLYSLKLRKADAPINGPGLANVTYEFACQAPAEAPADFPAVEKSKTPLVIRTRNKNPYHAFRQQH